MAPVHYSGINMLDDSVLDRFIPQFWDSFLPVQTKAAVEFRDEVDSYCRNTPHSSNQKKSLLTPPGKLFARRLQSSLKPFAANGRTAQFRPQLP